MNTIIIDDEQEIRDGMEIMLQDFAFVNVVEKASNIIEAKHKIELYKPELVFLDIQLHSKTGFDLLDQLEYLDFHLVFVTAYNEYALKAFKYNAFDYLLKPVNPLELHDTLTRLQETTYSAKQLIQQSLQNHDMKRVVVKTTKEIFIIELGDIVRCEASQGYTYFYLKDNKKILSSKTLKEYDDIMPDDIFVRVHQSHLVNLNYVALYNRDGTIILKNKDAVPVSIRKRSEFVEQFKQFKAAH
jgi:two-component system LytT family response regulator